MRQGTKAGIRKGGDINSDGHYVTKIGRLYNLEVRRKWETIKDTPFSRTTGFRCIRRSNEKGYQI